MCVSVRALCVCVCVCVRLCAPEGNNFRADAGGRTGLSNKQQQVTCHMPLSIPHNTPVYTPIRALCASGALLLITQHSNSYTAIQVLSVVAAGLLCKAAFGAERGLELRTHK